MTRSFEPQGDTETKRYRGLFRDGFYAEMRESVPGKVSAYDALLGAVTLYILTASLDGTVRLILIDAHERCHNFDELIENYASKESLCHAYILNVILSGLFPTELERYKTIISSSSPDYPQFHDLLMALWDEVSEKKGVSKSRLIEEFSFRAGDSFLTDVESAIEDILMKRISRHSLLVSFIALVMSRESYPEHCQHYAGTAISRYPDYPAMHRFLSIRHKTSIPKTKLLPLFSFSVKLLSADWNCVD